MSRSSGRCLAALFLIGALVAAPAAAAAGQSTGAVGGAALGSPGIVTPKNAPALPMGVSAASWVLADLDTGAVLAARDAHGQFLPASTLKVLTALTLIPRLNPRTYVRPTWQDVSVDGTKVGLVTQLRYSVANLFLSMLVVSANDAANTLAEAAGGMSRTVALMNAEAHHLQAYDTVARDPSGLDAPGQRTSAYDLALIARAALQLSDFRGYVTTRRAFIPAPPPDRRYEIDTHNKLLSHYAGAFGVKNGYTVAARATFIGAAARGGHRLIVTLMHAQPAVWRDAELLLDWGFKTDGQVPPVGYLVDPASPQLAPEAPAAATLPVHPAKAVQTVASTSSVLHRMPRAVIALAVALLGAVVGLITLRVFTRRATISI